MGRANFKFAVVDESGDIGNTAKSSRYFVLAAFLHNDENINRKIRKFIARLNHNKSGKKINVLHARNDTDKVKLKLVKFLEALDWKALAIVVDKQKQRVDYFECVQKLIFKMSHLEKISISMPITNKHDKKKILEISKKISIVAPTDDFSIQLCDFIAWSLYKKYEQKDSVYFDILKNNIEIF